MLEFKKLLENKDLQANERDLLQKIHTGCEPSKLLSFYRILKKYGLKAEATELLNINFAKNSGYIPFRTNLAHDYFERGLIHSAWNIITEPKYFDTLIKLSMPLLFKLSILLHKEDFCYSNYKNFIPTNEMEQNLIDIFRSEGIARAHDFLLKFYKMQGVFFNFEKERTRINESSFSANKVKLIPDGLLDKRSKYEVLNLRQIFRSDKVVQKDADKKFSKKKKEADDIHLSIVFYRKLLQVLPK